MWLWKLRPSSGKLKYSRTNVVSTLRYFTVNITTFTKATISPLPLTQQVIALIGAPEFGQTTGRYFHMHKEKPQRGDATDPELAQVIWNKVNEEIQRRHGRK